MVQPTQVCACGCGEPAKPKAKYVDQSHYAEHIRRKRRKWASGGANGIDDEQLSEAMEAQMTSSCARSGYSIAGPANSVIERMRDHRETYRGMCLIA